MTLMPYYHDLPKRIWLASMGTTSHKILSSYFPMEKETPACCFTWTSSPSLSHWSLHDLGCGLVSMFIMDTNLELTKLVELNKRSFIPLCVSTLTLIFCSLKCDVYQFPFHLLLCFHSLVLNNFSNFLLVRIPPMIDQSNKSNLVDSHHLVFRA